MILNVLKELQAEFELGLSKLFPLVIRIQPGAASIPSSDFVKPDHTNITCTMPVSPLRMTMTEGTTVQETSKALLQFLSSVAEGLEKPRIHVTPLYMEYDPKTELTDVTVRFDCVLWAYDGTTLTYFKFNGPDDSFENPTYHPQRHSVQTFTQHHMLSKMCPVETNVWLQNIATQAPTSGPVAPYLAAIQQQYAEQVEAATYQLHRLNIVARTTDLALEFMNQGDAPSACKIVADLLQTEVYTMPGPRSALMFVVGRDAFPPSFLFQYLALNGKENEPS